MRNQVASLTIVVFFLVISIFSYLTSGLIMNHYQALQSAEEVENSEVGSAGDTNGDRIEINLEDSYRIGIETLEISGRVPRSAIVWRDGSAWAYQESSPGIYHRVALDNLRNGSVIVRVGAQALLSEELRTQMNFEGE